MRRLNEVYVTWTNGRVEVVPKIDGIPRGVDNFFDPAHWDQSNVAQLLFDWFSILTVGLYRIEKMKDPGQVWEELCDSIEEFNEIGNACLRLRHEGERIYEGDKGLLFPSLRLVDQSLLDGRRADNLTVDQ